MNVKEFRIKVFVEEQDFCFSDLADAIFEGADNTGNHKILNVVEVKK